MKKFSGLLATTLALTLVFGMTAFAAGSKDTGAVDESKAAEDVKTVAQVTVANADATETINVSQAQEAAATYAAKDVAAKEAAIGVTPSDDAINAVVTDQGTVAATVDSVAPYVLYNIDGTAAAIASQQASSDQEVTAVKTEKAFDLEVTGVTGTFTFEIKLDGVTKAPAGYQQALMHLVGSTWVVEPCEVLADGTIKATVSSNSPFVLISYKVEQKEEDDDTPAAEAAQTTQTTATVTSPKTAETFPVAGVVALFAVACAAVAFKRVRYTK